MNGRYDTDRNGESRIKEVNTMPIVVTVVAIAAVGGGALYLIKKRKK